MLRRDGSGLPWGGKGEMLTQVERISKKTILAAGLRPELTFTSLGRHGGATCRARGRPRNRLPAARRILGRTRIETAPYLWGKSGMIVGPWRISQVVLFKLFARTAERREGLF